MTSAQYRQHHRCYGYFVPTEEIIMLLANGWRLLDQCPGYDGALLAPPKAWGMG